MLARGFLLEPFIADVLDQVLIHSLSHIGNVLDNVSSVDFDRNQIGRLQTAIQYVRIDLVLVALDQLNEVLDLLGVLHLLLLLLLSGQDIASRGQIGGPGVRREDSYARGDALVVAGVVLGLLVARLVDALKQVVYFFEVVLLS